jgi:GNAT superfamily N-acetyltransferase
VTRTRSEYRRTSPTTRAPLHFGIAAVQAHTVDRDVLATLLLDAYRGTIDDEGEDHADALAAIDHYLGIILPDHSLVLFEGDRAVALSFVIVVDDVHYIDPVTTAASHKGRGLGTAAVAESLRSLATADVHIVGATITDGNTPSERLFTSLGFTRIGSWGSAAE